MPFTSTSNFGTTIGGSNLNFGTLSPEQPELILAGQLPIATGVAHPGIQIVANTLTAGAGIAIVNGPGTITISNTGAALDITPNAGVHIINSTYTFTGAAVAAGGIPVQTNGLGAANLQLQVQRASQQAASAAANAGLASFSSAQFTVDANGFVTNLNGLPSSNFPVQASSGGGTNPVLPSAAGAVTINGAAVAAAGIPVRSDSIAANSLQIEVQLASAQGASAVANAGLASFDSTEFTVDGAGFVTMVNGLPLSQVTVNAAFGPGTNPVLPDAFGNMGVTGVAVAAAGIPIRTDSIAANSYQIEVQRASQQAVSAAANAGIASFDSTMFTVDANGFVQLAGGTVAADSFAMQSGISPVVPTGAGLITVNGAAVANVGVPVQSDGTGVSTYAIEVQRATTTAVTDATKVGLAAFNSAQFTVDINGFVSSISGTAPWLDTAGGALAAFTGYFVTAAAVVTLPAAPAQGTIIEIVDEVGGGVVLTSAGADTIRIGNVVSSAPGTATSTLRGDSLRLVYRTASASWIEVPGSEGSWLLA